MHIPVRQGLEGVFETPLQPGETKNGTPVLRAKVRVARWRRNDDGTFDRLAPVVYDLVIFDGRVRTTRLRFRVGDAFIASGRVNTYTVTRDRVPVQREEFVAHRIGHDAAATPYRVVRTAQRRRRRSEARRPTAGSEAPIVAGRLMPHITGDTAPARETP